MLTRIIYGLIAAAILIGFLMFKTYGFIAIIYIVGYMTIYEINNALNKGNIKSLSILGYAFITFLIPSYWYFGLSGILILFAICMYLNFIYHIFKQSINSNLIYSNIQLVYPCLPISFACPILLSNRGSRLGFAMMLSIVCCCFATDIFAYFAGVTFGKHKLCPVISPKKTIEGSAAGFIGSVVVSFGLYFAINNIMNVYIPLNFFISLGILCGIFAQLGDLTASMIKRICGIKDYGNVIPGHGGILDRLDSIIFCLPVAYMLMFFFGI